jgi:hypothetical protein
MTFDTIYSINLCHVSVHTTSDIFSVKGNLWELTSYCLVCSFHYITIPCHCSGDKKLLTKHARIRSDDSLFGISNGQRVTIFVYISSFFCQSVYVSTTLICDSP